MMSLSEDEYDDLPDITAGVDLDAIPALCLPVQPAQDTDSSEYSFDELDEDALAGVARAEAEALAEANSGAAHTPCVSDSHTEPSKPCPPTSPKRPPDHSCTKPAPSKTQPQALKTLSQDAGSSSAPTCTPLPKRPHAGLSSPPRKRRNVSPSASVLDASERPQSPTKQLNSTLPPAEKGQSVERMLAEFEDELTCPICCDLFVCTHVGNPCGHSFCGDCGWDWISKNLKAPTCASCRSPLSKDNPMFPNYSLDSAVRKHVEALGKSGVGGWGVGGARYLEWEERQKEWRAGDAKRAKLISVMHATGAAPPTAYQGDSPRDPIIVGGEPGG